LPNEIPLIRFQLERFWRFRAKPQLTLFIEFAMSNRAVPSLTVDHRAESQPEARVNNPKPAKRQRIPVPQRIRVMQLYAMGKNQTRIAREEKLNRETVGRIVHGSEMNEFVEEMRARFRGLFEVAIEALRRRLEEGGKEAIEIAWRVLEANGIIAPNGQVANYSLEPQDDSATEDESVSAAFAQITMERARVFQTPFPELQQETKQAVTKKRSGA
jgi:hypothetical protein